MQRFFKKQTNKQNLTAPDVGCGKHSWTHLNPPEAFDSASIQWMLSAYSW